MAETYYLKGEIDSFNAKEFEDDLLEFHKEHGPAKIFYYPNGKIEKECWYKNNKLHKEDGPAVIRYDIDGKIIEEFYFLNGIEVTNSLILFKIIKNSNKFQ